MTRRLSMKKAFTLIEAITALIIIGAIAVACVVSLRPADIKKESYKKAGLDALIRINLATKAIVSYDSEKHNMTVLKNTSGTSFVLASDTNRHLYLSQLYTKHLGSRAASSVDSTYTNTSLKNESGTAIGNFKVSNFSNGIFIKNGTYMAFKLNSNCTTSESNTIYDPSSTVHSASNSCGLIFFDINGKESPNIVGVDMYIVSIGKYGLK